MKQLPFRKHLLDTCFRYIWEKVVRKQSLFFQSTWEVEGGGSQTNTQRKSESLKKP